MTSSARLVPGRREEIAAELKVLRKGPAVHAADLDARLGAYLRELSSSGQGDDIAARREVLIAALLACASQLYPEPREAITVALALSGEARWGRNFSDRVGSLAARIGRDYRTALRRVDAAGLLLAEKIAIELRRRRSPTDAAPDGWYLQKFQVVLRLDTPIPESWEERRIVATSAGLDEVVAWLDAPSVPGTAAPDVTAEVTHGGRLIHRKHPSGDKYEFVVKLPRPLRPGETHAYGLLLRLSSHQQMTPHCIFTPECRCDLYDLRVRFHPGRLPGWVRRVSGETVRTFQAGGLERDLLAPDPAGEVHDHFHQPQLYLGYGFQWQP